MGSRPKLCATCRAGAHPQPPPARGRGRVTLNATSRWDAADYAVNAAFVPALGEPVLALLDARPGERILDLGCGDGTLTRRIVKAGAEVVGVDASAAMLAAAHDLDVRLMDGQALTFEADFDAVFTNAALHWMLDREAVAAGVFRALKPGGRFVGEMGGAGNVEALREALWAELRSRGHCQPDGDFQWYPTVEEFSSVYSLAGFSDIEARLIPRPTPLPAGIAAWILTFRRGLMDELGLGKAEQCVVAHDVQRHLASTMTHADGVQHADYVRLRFAMRKPA